MCQAMDEDLHHALVLCSHARQYWNAALGWLDLKLPKLHPITWAKDIVMDRMFSDQERCKIITIMHSIWSARNRWTHDQDTFNPEHVVSKIKEDLALLEVPSVQRKIAPMQCWHPPDTVGLRLIRMVPLMRVLGKEVGVALPEPMMPF